MDPIFVTIGPLELRWYGLLIAGGVLLGAVWGVRLARGRGLDPAWMLDMTPWMVLAGLVGARIVYVLTSPGAFFGPGGDPLRAFAVWEGGLSIHGAVAGVVLVLAWGARRQRYDVWRYLDVLAPVMALGIIGGRLGNFMNGTDTGGRLTDWAIGFRWPERGTETFGAVGRLVFGDDLWSGAPPACQALRMAAAVGGEPLRAFAVWEGGLSIHGAVAGVVLVLAWGARRQRYDVWRYLDVLAPVMALGIIGGRLGNFMNGTDTGGRPTDWAIGFRWPERGTETFGAFGRFVFGDDLWSGAPPACQAVRMAAALGGEPEACVVHLTQLYGALVGVLVLGVVLWALARAKKHGAVILHAFLWYSVIRSVIEEPFRDNPLPWQVYLNESAGVGLFTATQLASVAIVAVAWWLLSQRPYKTDEPAAAASAGSRAARPPGGARAAARREAARRDAAGTGDKGSGKRGKGGKGGGRKGKGPGSGTRS